MLQLEVLQLEVLQLGASTVYVTTIYFALILFPFRIVFKKPSLRLKYMETPSKINFLYVKAPIV